MNEYNLLCKFIIYYFDLQLYENYKHYASPKFTDLLWAIINNFIRKIENFYLVYIYP